MQIYEDEGQELCIWNFLISDRTYKGNDDKHINNQ